MPQRHALRYAIIGAVLALAAIWTLAAAQTEIPYANQRFVATPTWLMQHLDDPKVVVVDVRTDKHFDGKVIPGAVRMPWSLMRYNDRAQNLGGVFVGPEQAQEILGRHGITRDLEVVLYDNRERDGGATASYVFWVLDVLGHPKMRVLDGGIEAWSEAGGKLSDQPATAQVAVYQAPAKKMALRRRADGAFIYQRLGDPYYQVLDVRSKDEYMGDAPDIGLDGRVLKLGHIPGAYNMDYRLNWTGTKTKALKGPGELAALYAGLDPARAVVVYCHSGRRASYSYYVLRVVGFEDVICYERSWMEWGSDDRYFPAQVEPNELSGPPPRMSGAARSLGTPAKATGSGGGQAEQPGSTGGYISCGG